MGLAENVAKRFKRAGGESFAVFVKNPDPRAAFRQAVQDAEHESGHGGYSGTISEKSDFEVRKREPMSRDEAYDFAEKDEDHNDKWGPAFAVPIAETSKSVEKNFKVKVTARVQHEAWEPAKELVKQKFQSPGVSVTVQIDKTTLVKEGKLPEMKIDKGGPEGFRVRGGPRPSFTPPTLPSRAEAIAAFKAAVLADKPRSGETYSIEKFKTTDTFTIGDVTKSMHLFEIEGKVTLSKSTGKIIGWLFYGIASS